VRVNSHLARAQPGFHHLAIDANLATGIVDTISKKILLAAEDLLPSLPAQLFIIIHADGLNRAYYKTASSSTFKIYHTFLVLIAERKHRPTATQTGWREGKSSRSQSVRIKNRAYKADTLSHPTMAIYQILVQWKVTEGRLCFRREMILKK
jgi:hypothetical protein